MDGMSDTKPVSNLARLSKVGTSVWLDFVSRGLLQKGELAKLIEQDDVRGVTSNPAIFEKAIAHGDEYDSDLFAYQKTGDHTVSELFDHLAIGDIQAGADALLRVYEKTNRLDGYISLEVSPYLAMDTQTTISEARRLWQRVDRRNLMVKVPGTSAGTPAVETLIGDGININVTLLFSNDAYKAVAEAYMAGLEAFAAKGGDVAKVASVASFFVSRIDSLIDKESDEKLKTATPEQAAVLQSLRGKVAIANAKMAYQLYKELIASPRWQALAAKGAQPQRLLWASTGTKLKGLPDTLYVDTLVGPDVVNTMPPATMDATRDHGASVLSIEDDIEGAKAVLAALATTGISLDQVTAALVVDGVQQFADAADKLYGAVAMKRGVSLNGNDPQMMISLGDKGLEDAVAAETEKWRAGGLIRKLWAHDKTLWTGDDEHKWEGWLSLPEDGIAALGRLQSFQDQVAAAGYADVVLLGMGGSSLGPEVLAETFGHRAGFPKLTIVDSTDPAQLQTVTDAIDLARTLFIVSSKSGSTLEPNIFHAYFYDLLGKITAEPGKSFVAVTDPGSGMEKKAKDDSFAHIFYGDTTVGGRFSVLSMFGLVPAAAIGIDLPGFLAKTLEMARSCGPDVPPAINPGVQLGTAMGVLARGGRDKATIIASPGIGDIGAWLEQLFAESTGKIGRGIVPVAEEPVGPASVYGRDRLFIYLELEDAPDLTQREEVNALEAAGEPVIRIIVPNKLHLGQEFFRFEVATAVVGAVLNINPFNQPDVEASKIATRKLTEAYEQNGDLPKETPLFSADGISLFADAANTERLGSHGTLTEYLGAFLNEAGAGDYVGLLAYIQRNAPHIAALQDIRTRIRDARHLATVVGFGPRFLHSTGQAYKGGPNSGVFLQITCNDAADLAVPGHKYGFSIVKAAQAQGDLQVLNERKRRALRVHLDAVEPGLATLGEAISAALG